MNTVSHRPTRRLLGIGAAAAAGAALVNAAIYGVGRAVDLTFVASTTSARPQHILLQHVVSFTLMTFAIGLVAAFIVDRMRRPSLRMLQVVGAFIAVASISMDVSIDSSFAAKATLALMHIVVGVAYVCALELARSPRPAAATGLRPARAGRVTSAGRAAA